MCSIKQAKQEDQTLTLKRRRVSGGNAGHASAASAQPCFEALRCCEANGEAHVSGQDEGRGTDGVGCAEPNPVARETIGNDNMTTIGSTAIGNDDADVVKVDLRGIGSATLSVDDYRHRGEF